MSGKSIKKDGMVYIAFVSTITSIFFVSIVSISLAVNNQKTTEEFVSQTVDSIFLNIDGTMTESYQSKLIEILRKTGLQEIAITSTKCQIFASSSLRTPEKNCFGSLGFKKIVTSDSGKDLWIFYKDRLGFFSHLHEWKYFLLTLFVTSFFLTFTILLIFLLKKVLKPLRWLEENFSLTNPREKTLPSELGFIGKILWDTQSNIQAREKEMLYYETARTVVHDIRNPLQALKIISSSDSKTNRNVLKEKIEEIESQINLLLASKKCARINRSSTKKIKEYVTLENNLLYHFRLELISSEDFSFTTFFDETRLKSTLANLMRNSSEANSSELYISLVPSNDMLEIIFRDNGVGISLLNADKIFKSFSSKKEGHGIGLRSIKQFLEECGGTISLVPQDDNKGATFKICIPIQDLLPLSQTWILIDDDKYIRNSWINAAQSFEIELKTFANIEEFLEKENSFKKESPIFIDSDLGNGVKGEIQSQKLFQLGFKTIYLATGYTDITPSSFPWIKNVFSKEFPLNPSGI